MTFPLNYGLSKAGLPLIVAKIFEHDICLMLDTGSNRNIIDQRIYDHFKDRLKQPETPSSVYTLNGAASGKTIEIPFSFEEQDYLEPFICSETAETFDKINDESGIQIHGLLGNHFFLKHGWVLDFDKITVYQQ